MFYSFRLPALMTWASGERSITEAALRAGHRVVATARKPEQLDDLVAKYGSAILPLALDVTDNRQVQKVVAEAVQHFGRLDSGRPPSEGWWPPRPPFS
jgi:NADP-dependent 3-hydroxy acid dehydrogenase YdfG